MKLGDLVELKTGDGPLMVVDAFLVEYDQKKVFCTWYKESDNKFVHEGFSEFVLKVVEIEEAWELLEGMTVELRNGDDPKLVIEKLFKDNNGVQYATCVYWSDYKAKHIYEDFSAHVLMPVSI